MKAILVLEMPENCFKCKLQIFANCIIVKGCHTGDTRPEWCPLKPMLKKNEDKAYTMTQLYRAQGYNACIDEILGDKE